jgi:hypothetical protein
MIGNLRGHPLSTQERVGYAVGWFGVVLFAATLLFGIWLEYARPGQPHAFVYLPVCGFAALGWWGFFWAKPRRATAGAGVLVDTYRKVRPGLRDSDDDETQVVPAHVVLPEAPNAIRDALEHGAARQRGE